LGYLLGSSFSRGTQSGRQDLTRTHAAQSGDYVVLITASNAPSAVRCGIEAKRLQLVYFGFLVLGICVCLLSAATALAARSPDPGERAAIERVARRDQAFRQYPIRVTISDIEVSTAGPWATASVVVQARENSAVLQEIQEVYHRSRRGWIGSQDPRFSSYVVPAKVERDLGLSSRELRWVKIVVWVVMALGAAAVLAGIAWLLSRGAGRGDTQTAPARFSAPQPVDSEPWRTQAKKRVPCPAGCRSGRKECPECGWRRVVQDPATSEFATCEICGGQLFLCDTCHGAGSIEV
jgi:hypothetical protein